MKNIFKGETRYAYFPIQFNDMHEYFKKAESTFWKASEIDFSEDKRGYDKLSNSEKHFLKNTLSFFASSDGIVNQNIMDNILPKVTTQEAIAYYSMQSAIECVHNETYSLQIQTIADNEKELNELLGGAHYSKSVKDKMDWAKKWLVTDNLSRSVLGFAIVEGLFFSTSFCSIFWLDHLKKRLPGIIQANKLINTDEALHAEVACHVYKNYCDKLSEEEVHQMFKEAVEAEKQFATEGLPVKLIGMSDVEMCKYIEFVADGLLTDLGMKPIYNTSNPFSFMVKLAAHNAVNFFESRNDQYNKPSQSLNLNADF